MSRRTVPAAFATAPLRFPFVDDVLATRARSARLAGLIDSFHRANRRRLLARRISDRAALRCEAARAALVDELIGGGA